MNQQQSISSIHDNVTRSSRLVIFSNGYKSVHTPLVISICIFGVLCNLANVVVLTKPKMRTSPTNVILTALSVSQICLLINFLCYTVYTMFDSECDVTTKTYTWLVYVLLNVNMNVLFHTIGLVHTSLIAIFRYIAVAYAASMSHWVTVSRAKRCIFITYALVPVACSTFYFNSEIVGGGELSPNCSGAFANVHDNNTPIVVRYKLSFTSNQLLLAYNFWVLATFCKLLPCFCLAALSALLLYELHKVKQRRRRLRRQSRQPSSDSVVANSVVVAVSGDSQSQQHNRITVMLLMVVLLFVSVELPQGVLNLMAAVRGFETVRYIQDELADFFDMLTVFYSSVNFILYCTMSSQFRQCFGEIFCWSCWTKLHESRDDNKRSKTLYMPMRPNNNNNGYGNSPPVLFKGTDV